MKKSFLAILTIVCFGVTGCLDKDNTFKTYPDATVTAFSFNANSDFPGLEEAYFRIKELTDTGLIYTDDSLRFGTRIDSVTVVIGYTHAPSSAWWSTPDTSFFLSGTDTLNLSKMPVYLTVLSSDETTTKTYEIKVYVHQVNPELVVWERMTDRICPEQPAEQKGVKAGDTFCFFVNNGFTPKLYTSTDLVSWTENTVSGLPSGCKVSEIVWNDKTQSMYCCADAQLMTSMDGKSWSAADIGMSGLILKRVLMVFNDKIWALMENGDKAYILASSDGENAFEPLTGIFPGDTLPSLFPVSDYALVNFESSSRHHHALIAGGYAKSGQLLSNRWNIEYNSVSDAYRVADYATPHDTVRAFYGAGMTWYDHKIYMFGAADEDMNIMEGIYYSDDEGVNWQRADTASNRLPDTFEKRYRTSVLTDGEYMYIFGGQSRIGNFTDVYRGRLNSILWDK